MCSSPARWQLWQRSACSDGGLAKLQYGALPPDCHTVVDTNSVITLLMCLFCMISLALLYLDSIWPYKIDDKVK